MGLVALPTPQKIGVTQSPPNIGLEIFSELEIFRFVLLCLSTRPLHLDIKGASHERWR